MKYENQEQLGDDERIWGEIFDAYLEDLYRYVRAEIFKYGIAHAVEVDDLVQSACCRLIENGDPRQVRSRTEGEVRGYLKAMARSIAIDWLRGRYAQKRGPQYQKVPLLEQSDLGLWDQRLEPEAEYLLMERLKNYLSFCRKRLEGRNLRRDFEYFLWSRMLGMTGKEIALAQTTRVNPKSVCTVLSRIKKKILSPPSEEKIGTKTTHNAYCRKAMIEWIG